MKRIGGQKLKFFLLAYSSDEILKCFNYFPERIGTKKIQNFPRQLFNLQKLKNFNLFHSNSVCEKNVFLKEEIQVILDRIGTRKFCVFTCKL